MEREQRRNSRDQHEPEEMFALLILVTAIAALFVWIASRGLHLRGAQVGVIVTTVGFTLVIIFMYVRYRLDLPGLIAAQWPRPPLYVPWKKEQAALREADKTGSVLLGFENDGTAVIWTEDQRTMQTNMPGASGAGKTTALINLAEQDIRHGHPLIFLDGKGEKGLVLRLANMAYAAGRGKDLLIIDSTYPEESQKFNPFYAEDGFLQHRVSAVFDSLSASQVTDPFFSEHQREFLAAVTTILQHTGRQFTFWDVLVACQHEDLMVGLIENLRAKVQADPALKEHQRNGFEIQASWLMRNYADKNWATLIRGLENAMMPFVGESLAAITTHCDNLVTFEDVVEQKKILLISMNVGIGSSAVKAFGRILMRNLQFMIASRFNEYRINKRAPFISVFLDEFGLFSYEGFKTIIHTARQAGGGFVFSFQNTKQLANDVGAAFADDVASAVSNKFMLRISEEKTAEGFTQASSRVPTDQFNIRVRKTTPLDQSPYTEAGEGGTKQVIQQTRVQDHHVKMLPTGQMVALLQSHEIGVDLKFVHSRCPFEPAFDIQQEWVPHLKSLARDSKALNLTINPSASCVSTDGPTGQRRRSNATEQSFGEGVRALLGGDPDRKSRQRSANRPPASRS